MAYYFECETRNIYDGKEVVETVDMDIFLEFLEDYHEEKWKEQAWYAVSQCVWIEIPVGDIKWRRGRVRAYKRYVEHAFDTCFAKKCKKYAGGEIRSPMYKAYCYFIKANYNN